MGNVIKKCGLGKNAEGSSNEKKEFKFNTEATGESQGSAWYSQRRKRQLT